ncbi:MAG TPA: hypothetical protein VF522_17080 [Ramlibacter sp.]|uniref:hypothetical protein n=1 Tax=Ramlibacter sp. TaxID=1917967 RepID=UPI002ED11975
MRRASCIPSRLPACLLAAGLAAACLPAQSQSPSPTYELTVPALLAEPDAPTRASILLWGPVRLAASGSMGGSGLSLEAGQKWFARAGVGRSFDAEYLDVGGGYRFPDGQALSMHVTRQFGQEGLGLAVRYDWHRSYLRLSYETPVRALGTPDRLRFSAGVRF